MQGLSREAGDRIAQHGVLTGRHARLAAIQRVPDERVALVRKMNSDLMRTPCFQANMNMRRGRMARTYPVVRDCDASALAHCHAQPILGMAVNRGIDGTTTGKNPVTYGLVLPVDFALGQLPDQGRMCGQRLGDQQEA